MDKLLPTMELFIQLQIMGRCSNWWILEILGKKSRIRPLQKWEHVVFIQHFLLVAQFYIEKIIRKKEIQNFFQPLLYMWHSGEGEGSMEFIQSMTTQPF